METRRMLVVIGVILAVMALAWLGAVTQAEAQETSRLVKSWSGEVAGARAYIVWDRVSQRQFLIVMGAGIVALDE